MHIKGRPDNKKNAENALIIGQGLGSTIWNKWRLPELIKFRMFLIKNKLTKRLWPGVFKESDK